MYVVVVSFIHDDSSELDTLDSICVVSLSSDSIPGEMPGTADTELFNEYSNPIFVLSDWDFVNFMPVVIFNCLDTASVPYLDELKMEQIISKRHRVTNI